MNLYTGNTIMVLEKLREGTAGSSFCWGREHYKSEEERGTNMLWNMERVLKSLDPKRLQQLREHERETGQPIEEAIREALDDWIDSQQSGIERHNRN